MKKHGYEVGARFPFALRPLWEIFCELNLGRGSNGFGANHLSSQEIYCWSQLHGVTLQPWELSILRKLDNLFVKTINAQKQ